ncbi:DUF974-domain-containing protein [Russula earlei]|uniref:DUF974-domain-containing protein n=1 Tax=Russula earlei TaxID=71964 RepID=A0ACC0UEG4_9AGAM|nr:DUF974-domain-containing protein [Russula earlei]
MDGGHLLSLKVMRVSRPSLASTWEPFYSNSPSFSAHSTASVLSLQGSNPLPGHPKTLRDLTNASTLLTLPSSFGAIQLGETFSSAVAVNNESAAMVDSVSLRVEMQTATSKVVLVEMGGPTLGLVAGDTLETAVHHEIKELGQHVLACTVSYQLPPGARRPATSATTTVAGGSGGADTGDDVGLQTFRKFYKFAVTNPLSVKTKVHLPRSPSALLSTEERSKVFLEVHIQNLTSEPMWFEHMIIEPAPGWHVQDANVLSDSQGSLFSGAMAMFQPQDTRQYIYILNEVNPSAIPVQHAPGTVLALGRLDISWRSSFGEPGRLLTSMLSRRIPLSPNSPPARTPQQQHPHQPASALPLHLQRSATAAGYSSQPPSRPNTPPIGPAPHPHRSSSPFRNRPMSVPPPRPQSPGMSTAHFGSSAVAVDDPINVDLVVRSIPRGEIQIGKPFCVACTLGVAASVREGEQRTLSLAVQHPLPPPPPPSETAPSLVPTTTDRLASAVATAISSSPASRTSLTLVDGPLVGSPRARQLASDREEDDPAAASRQRVALLLPAPEPMPGDEARYDKLRGATRFLGASLLHVPPMTLVRRTASEPSSSSSSSSPGSGRGGAGGDDNGKGDAVTKREERFWDFELQYTPLRNGFVPVGGLRVLLLEDRVQGAEEAYLGRRTGAPVVLKECDVIGEVWVRS